MYVTRAEPVSGASAAKARSMYWVKRHLATPNVHCQVSTKFLSRCTRPQELMKQGQTNNSGIIVADW
jgi:hypothetical protein